MSRPDELASPDAPADEHPPEDAVTRGPSWAWIATTAGAIAGGVLYALWTYKIGAAVDDTLSEPLVLVMAFMFGTLIGGLVSLIGASIGGTLATLAPMWVVLPAVLVGTALAGLLMSVFASVAIWGDRLIWIGALSVVTTLTAAVAVLVGRSRAS